MNATQSLRFVLAGILASATSWGVYELALQGPEDVWRASLWRWAALLPILYLLYSRWVLRETLLLDRDEFGWRNAEARMAARVLASVGASTLAKLALEAPISSALIETFGLQAAVLSPILADFVYGPLANYLTLALLNRRDKSSPETED